MTATVLDRTAARVVAIVEARMGSTRLPGKIMRPIVGKPMLELLIERLGRARRVHAVVVATTDAPADGAVEALTERLGVGCFRGSEDDVLARVLGAADAFRADVVVEVTGDCPLVDPVEVDRVVAAYVESRHDFVGNRVGGERPMCPDGFGVRVFSRAALADVARATADPAFREHVSLYMWTHPAEFSVLTLSNDLTEEQRQLEMSVDTADDLALVSRVFEALYPANPAFGLPDVLDLLDRRPELRAMSQPRAGAAR